MLSLNLTAHSIVALHNEMSMTFLTAQGIYTCDYRNDQGYSTSLLGCRKVFVELWPMKLFDLGSLSVDL